MKSTAAVRALVPFVFIADNTTPKFVALISAAVQVVPQRSVVLP